MKVAQYNILVASLIAFVIGLRLAHIVPLEPSLASLCLGVFVCIGISVLALLRRRPSQIQSASVTVVRVTTINRQSPLRTGFQQFRKSVRGEIGLAVLTSLVFCSLGIVRGVWQRSTLSPNQDSVQTLEVYSRSYPFRADLTLIPVVQAGQIRLCRVFGPLPRSLVRGDRFSCLVFESNGEFHCRDPDSITVIPRSVLFDSIHESIDAGMQANSTPARALIKSLVLGDKSRLKRRQKRLFKEVGGSHFLAISGLHLSILVGFVLVLLKFCGLALKPRTTIALGFALFYVWLVGFRPAIARAGLTVLLFCLAQLTARRFDSLKALLFSALVCLAIYPNWLTDIGFQLSYVIVLALILSLRAYHAFNQVYQRESSWLKLEQVVFVSVVAFFAGVPLILHYFENIAPASVVTSVLCGPVVACLLIVGVGASGLSLVSESLARPVFCIAEPIYWFLLWLMEKIHSIGAYFEIEPNSNLSDFVSNSLFPVTCYTGIFVLVSSIKTILVVRSRNR